MCGTIVLAFLFLTVVHCYPYKSYEDIGLELVFKAAGKLFNANRKEWKPKSLEEALLPIMMDNQPKDELTPPSEEPYNFYSPPFYNDNYLSKDLKDTLTPPLVSVDRTNYYETTKVKKVPKKFVPEIKQINLKTASSNEGILDNLDNYDDKFKKSMIPLKSDLPPMPVKLIDYEDNISVASVLDGTFVKPSKNEQQIKFQFHGMGGPDSYKFGYDTGKGKDRQYRFEEKDHLGNVIGEYGYYDKNEGKMMVTRFVASREGGFHVI